jgi:hypothetical protein
MAEFAKYYVEFLWEFIQNLWQFIIAFPVALYNFIVKDTISYFKTLSESVSSFDVLGWVCLILVSILQLTLVFFLVYRLVQLIRRYIIFRAKEVEKDKLLEEVARLHEQSEKLVKEKNQIFSLKIGARLPEDGEGTASGVPATLDVAEGQQAVEDVGPSRFTKLIALDEKYKRNPHFVRMTDGDMLSLKDVVTNFINFAASQLKLYYSEETIRIYFAGMATSRIIILEGISGTGKTSLPYAMGKFFGNNTSIISVQPAWRDRAELIGYFNEFTKKFNETDFLSSLYETTLREDPNFIVLDEMNLARIEYYFADFLSIMEMPDIAEWKIDLISSPQPSDPKNVFYGKLLVPQNVWFVGTANNDDSTFTITDKVYDRAVAIELNEKASYFDAPLTNRYNCSAAYLESLFTKAQNDFAISDENLDKIKELDLFIREKFKISFGNRIMKQLKLFVPVYIACGGTELGGIDFIITSKILRKFTSLNLPFLTKELGELVAFFDKKFGKGKMKASIAYIKELQRMN